MSRVMSEEHKKKLADKTREYFKTHTHYLKGKKLPKKVTDAQIKALQGSKASDEHKKKISEGMRKFYSENKHWNKSGSWTDARKEAQRTKIVIAKPIIKKGKEYHPAWHEIRKVIYSRDKWICKCCKVHCHNSKRIACHHIDYDVTNNEPENLVTLCASCHMKTNFKRIDWMMFFNGKQNCKTLRVSAESAW